MRERVAILVSVLIICASTWAAQGMGGKAGIGGNEGLGGGPSLWSVIQHPSNFTCFGMGTGSAQTLGCTVTVTATTAGNLLLLLTSFASGHETVAATYSSATGDTFTHCPAQYSTKTSAPSQQATDCAYVLSAAGGATSITVNWTATIVSSDIWNTDIELIEVHRSSGTAAFDGCTSGGNCIATATSSPSTSPTFSITGPDFVAQWISQNNAGCTISGAAYIQPFDVDSGNVASSFAGAPNQATAPAQTWYCPGITLAAMSGVAFK